MIDRKMYRFVPENVKMKLTVDLDLKIQDIAEKMGMVPQALGAILNGRANPSVKTLEKLMDATCLGPLDLFTVINDKEVSDDPIRIQ